MDSFRGIYCGLCKQMGKSFGSFSRLTLSYDITFLALLRYARNQNVPPISTCRCVVNPLHKVPMCPEDEILIYSADIAALMVYYKLEDNVLDSGVISGLSWRFLRWRASLAKKKAAKRHPKADEIIKQMMESQQAMEQENTSSIDDACHPTAFALGELAADLSSGEENDTQKMRRFGYLLGRYIYLCDALDDLEKDLKHNNFNPFINRFSLTPTDKLGIDEVKKYARGSLFFTISTLAGASKELNLLRFQDLVENIVSDGMIGTVNRIMLGQKAEQKNFKQNEDISALEDRSE